MIQPTAAVALILAWAPCAAQSPEAFSSSAQSAPERSAKPRLPVPGHRDRDVLDGMLKAEQWAIRAFGLMRLERYADQDVADAIRNSLRDEDWRVQCFAITLAAQSKLAIAPGDLVDEPGPQVVRAALRHHVPMSEEIITEVTSRLLRAKGLDDLMLGIEIAAASDIETLRQEASRRLTRLVRNMDLSIATVLGSRLASVLGLDRVPQTPDEWRESLAGTETDRTLPLAPRQARPVPAPPSTIATLDDEAFVRLQDYLDVLRRRDLDMVVVMDATASMIPMINQVRAGVDSLILFLNDITREMRLAFVAYRDRDNQPVTSVHGFTDDVRKIREFLFRVPVTGGADYPEAVLDGLEACLELGWKRQATREIVLVGDAPPHSEDIYRVTGVLDSLRNDLVTVHAVHVPMQYPAGHVERMTADEAQQAGSWLEEYNRTTAEHFATMAAAGGGHHASITAATKLVPAIMHFAIEEAWWPVFDEFYARYLELCR